MLVEDVIALNDPLANCVALSFFKVNAEDYQLGLRNRSGSGIATLVLEVLQGCISFLSKLHPQFTIGPTAIGNLESTLHCLVRLNKRPSRFAFISSDCDL